MKILLIDPPTNCFTGLIKRGYPIGLCMLAAVVKQENIAEVNVYDVDKSVSPVDGLNFTDQRHNMARFLEGVKDAAHPIWAEIKNRLTSFQPDIVGITTMTIQYASALQVARVVKDWNRSCFVIMGGAHASVMPRGMIAWPYTDIVVKGDGEEVFLKIIRRLKTRSKSIEDLPGVITKDTIQQSLEPPLEVKDLDALPFPDRHALLHLDQYSPEDMGLLLTSRGCPYRCSYCSNFSRITRFRSVENVLEEIVQVRKTFGTKQFMFKDDAFTLQRKRGEDFCREILKRKIRILWESATRLDLIDDSLVKLMKTAGCNRIGVGIESGDDEMLRVYNKRLTKEQIRKGTAILNSNKIFWTGYFMMGLPMECEEQICRTLEFMKELSPPYAAIGIYKPYPGTQLFELAKGLNLVNAGVSNDHFFHTNPVDYFFTNPHQRCAYISEQRLTELTSQLKRAFERSNKSLSNIIKRGLARRSLYFNDYKSFLTDCKRAIRWLLS